jgi:hypothetical protein
VFEQKNNRLSIYSEHLAESSLSNHHPITIRQATEDDRQKLAMLVHFEVYVHRHLDWRPPLDWLGSQPYLLQKKMARSWQRWLVRQIRLMLAGCVYLQFLHKYPWRGPGKFYGRRPDQFVWK